MFSGYSWKNSFSSSIAAVALLSVCSINVRAASDTFTFSEAQKDSLVCSNKTSESCDTITTGTFAVKALFFAADPSTVLSITPADELDVTIGDWEFSGAIEDTKFTKTSATFELPNKAGTVEFTRSTKGLGVSVKAKTGATETEELQPSVIANAHATDNAAFTDTIDVSISINSGVFTDSFTVGVSGVAVTKPTVKDGSTFDLNSVKVKSTGITAE